MSWIHARWILVASWQNSNVHRQNKACFLSSRALLIRLIDLTNGNSKPFFKIGMTKEVKKELNVLECFLEHSMDPRFFSQISGQVRMSLNHTHIVRVLSVMQRYSVVSVFMETGIVIGNIIIPQS